MPGQRRSSWGSHAASVEDVVLERHGERVRNHGGGDWKVVGHRVVVIYNHPDDGDPATALLVTLWRLR